MSGIDELRDTIEARLATIGLSAATIERSPTSTIVPEVPEQLEAARRALAKLTRLERPEDTLEGARLELHGTIGEGGMGIVRVATQRALGRSVAVKTLKDEHRGEAQTVKLLREAWVTGNLEHPNIIPVYDIALDEGGNPLIVLKKIEGDEWASLIHDEAAVGKRFGADDLLEHNLRILMQVCNAVRFAHSRAVLHRDLKPENVMIGSFGEVYLVDWGIAVALEDDGSGRLPLASEAHEMAGTPVYMAPEMLGGPKARLSVRTDVYLLGAILYEIVAGHAPHVGDSLMELVAQIVDSNPPMPEGAPPELARIISRAMDPDPDARFENVEQLRLAVQGFLTHRDASRLAERAQERLDELQALLAHEAEADPEADVEDRREAVYRVFGECRFGFRHALEVWPLNEAARGALDEAIEAMVRYELRLGEPEAARALLTEIEQPPAGLADEVEASRALREREDAELRRISADQDPLAGRRTRSFLAAVIGVLWVAVPTISGTMVKLGYLDQVGHEMGVSVTIAYLTLIAGGGYWARESLSRTKMNRTIGAAAVLAMGLHLVSVLLGWAIDRHPFETMHTSLFMWAGLIAVVAVAVDLWLLAPALVYAAAYVFVALVGTEWVLLSGAFANLALLVTMVVRWMRRDDLVEARKGIERRAAERRARR